MISYIRISLELWFEKHKQKLFFSHPLKTVDEHLQIMQYKVASQPGSTCYFFVELLTRTKIVSAHIVLHRLLATFLHIATTVWQMNLQDALQLTDDAKSWPISTKQNKFVELLLEEPLRIQVLMAQIKAKMWKKNGLSMVALVRSYYSSNFWDKGFQVH